MSGTVKPLTPFIDLRTPYAAQRERIDARMRAVLEHGQFILGPEVQELEERLAAYTEAASDARHPRARGAEAHLPVSDALAAQVISLPMYPDLACEVQDRIAAAVTGSPS